MNGRWTFSDIDVEWVHDLFETKQEAIEEAKKWYDESFLVGQLDGSMNNHGNYKVINIEEVKVI